MTMNAKIGSTFRSKLPATLASVAALTGMVAVATPARASVSTPEYQWVPLSTGLATAIAVGPNNVPWVLGWGTAPQGVYYYSPSTSCVGLDCEPEWQYDGFNGMTLAVDLNGAVWATDENGVINGDSMSVAWEYSHGSVTPPPVPLPGGAGSWGPAGPGEVSSFAVAIADNYYSNLNGELFVEAPNQYAPYGSLYAQKQFWGVGCGSQCYEGPSPFDASLWTQDVQSGFQGPISSGWTVMGGGARSFAVFTDPPTGATTAQTPWVLDAEGGVFSWTGGGWQYQPTPELVTSLTDHHIRGASGNVYAWNGTSSGQGNTTWTKLPLVNYNLNIKQIAYAEAIGNTPNTPGNTIGPSQLWGIDADNGVIYCAQWVQTVVAP